MLAIATAVSIPFLTRYAEKKALRGKWRKQDGEKQDKQEKQKLNIRNMWEIEDIRNGVIQLKGNRYSAILKLGTINYNLLSGDEQSAVENILMAVATGLDFPVQFLCATEVIDTRRAINEVYEHNVGEQSQVRRTYAQSLLNYLEDLMSQRTVLIKHTYAVVTCLGDESRSKTLGKLEHRCSQLINGLSRARITALPLTSEEIADILFKVMNRRKSVRPSDAVRAGALDYCVSGKGVRNVQISEAKAV